MTYKPVSTVTHLLQQDSTFYGQAFKHLRLWGHAYSSHHTGIATHLYSQDSNFLFLFFRASNIPGCHLNCYVSEGDFKLLPPPGITGRWYLGIYLHFGGHKFSSKSLMLKCWAISLLPCPKYIIFIQCWVCIMALLSLSHSGSFFTQFSYWLVASWVQIQLCHLLSM